jgi:hypothetical protein
MKAGPTRDFRNGLTELKLAIAFHEHGPSFSDFFELGLASVNQI